MKALQVGDLPVGNWVYELKFDGYRALVSKADKDVRLVSRNRKAFVSPLSSRLSKPVGASTLRFATTLALPFRA